MRLEELVVGLWQPVGGHVGGGDAEQARLTKKRWTDSGSTEITGVVISSIGLPLMYFGRT